MLRWQDILIIVADNVPRALFEDNKKYGKKLIVWKIKDETEGNKNNMRKIIKAIMSKVNKLKEDLK